MLDFHVTELDTLLAKAFWIKTIAELEATENANEDTLEQLRMSQSENAALHLTARMESLSEKFGSDMLDLNDEDRWEPIDSGHEQEDEAGSLVAAYVRGELAHPCTCDTAAHWREHFRHKATATDVRITLREVHQRCAKNMAARQDFIDTSKFPPAWVPARFAHHRVHTLAPHPKMPLDIETQRTPISLLPKMVDDITGGTKRGWLLVGPAGCSKSTYISAVLLDVFVLRWMALEPHQRKHQSKPHMGYYDRLRGLEPPDRDLAIWRVRVPDWLREMQAYDTRDFGQDVPSPSITAEMIRQECQDLSLAPILWLEEIDKFNATATRRNYLFRLIDAVYEMGGTTIASANLCLEGLNEHLEDPIFRRLKGTFGEDEGEYSTWDFHEVVAKAKKKRAKGSSA